MTLSPRRSLPCRALVATLLAPGLLAARGAGDVGPAGDDRPAPHRGLPAALEIVRVVRDLRAPEPEPTEILLGRLEELAPSSLPSLFDMLAERRVPALEDAPRQTLSEAQEALVLDALRAQERDFLRSELARWRATPANDDERAATMRALGVHGTSTDLRRLCWLALPPGAAEPSDRLADAFRAAVTDALRFDVALHRTLEADWRELPAPLAPLLVQATGAARDPHGLPFLSRVVVWRHDLALLAIAQVRLVGPSWERGINQELADRIRPYLDPGEKIGCQSAALALATLEDTQSVGALIELLDSGVEGVPESALWALHAISGMELPADSRRWRDWYESEVAWFELERARLFQTLRAWDKAKIAGAVKTMTQHRLYRHELATELATLCFHHKRDFRELACRGLAQLRSPFVVPDLVDLLNDRFPEVRRSAWETLRALTGADLPQDPVAWEAFAATKRRR